MKWNKNNRIYLKSSRTKRIEGKKRIKIGTNMFAIDSLEFETLANRHLFEYPASTSADLFLCNDNSSDSDLYSSYNSDQENNLDKLWVQIQSCFYEWTELRWMEWNDTHMRLMTWWEDTFESQHDILNGCVTFSFILNEPHHFWGQRLVNSTFDFNRTNSIQRTLLVIYVELWTAICG